MLGLALRLAGHRAAHRVITRGKRPFFELGLGFALMRDRRVPIARKALSLLLGGAIVLALVGLELPVEALVGFLLNLFGVGLDIAVDGLEMVIGPALIGSLLLVRLAPAGIVEAIRLEREASRLAPAHN